MLKATNSNVIVSIDLDRKNWHTFSDGTVIRLERQSDDANRRYSEPVQGIVIDAENVPIGAEVLLHHNSTHDTYQLYNTAQLGGFPSDTKIFSIPETMVYLYREGCQVWQPLKCFCITTRIFEPYKGKLTGIAPKQIKNSLYVKTGQFKDLAVLTLKNCDYEIIYQMSGREHRIIRTRDNDTEILAIDHTLTEQINNGEMLIGLTPSTAKQLKQDYVLT